MMELKGDQPKAWDSIMQWWNTPKDRRRQVFRLFGGAGVGKTTVAKKLQEIGNIAYMCLSGKAALVLEKKGCAGATTIHSRIYRPVEDTATGKVHFKLNREALDGYDLIALDEVGMVDEEQGMDILSFGLPVIVLGDGNQLPPPSDKPSFFLNDPADFTMREILRQARDNPIIDMAYQVLETGTIKPGKYGDSEVFKNCSNAMMQRLMMEADQVLCGKNLTRKECNTDMRKWLDMRGEEMEWLPVVGDRLICLRNNHEKMILNGELFEMDEIVPRKMGKGLISFKATSIDLIKDSQEFTVPWAFFAGTEEKLDRITLKNFDQFTYGYVLTVHKAQGSQWDNVLVLDESRAFRDFRKNHLYTAITRAAESVKVVL